MAAAVPALQLIQLQQNPNFINSHFLSPPIKLLNPTSLHLREFSSFITLSSNFDQFHQNNSKNESTGSILANSKLHTTVSVERTMLFPEGSQHWLVCVEKPSANVQSKLQIVDYYVSILSKVLGNYSEKDAQMCIYHLSWQVKYEFCCILNEECARELAVVPGVLSIQLDEQFESKIKDHGGDQLLSNALHPREIETSKTKLFITGLSFYTSEKTLRAAFEPFGELVEVKVIMDKISKRSKGYAFIEYATEDNATTALEEMNGKIINGWMIVVDRAKVKQRIRKGRPRAMLPS